MQQQTLNLLNRAVTFKMSEYIGEKLHQHHLGDRTLEVLRPRSHFTDYKRLKHALNHIKTHRERLFLKKDRVKTEADDRPVTVHFQRTSKNLSRDSRSANILAHSQSLFYPRTEANQCLPTEPQDLERAVMTANESAIIGMAGRSMPQSRQGLRRYRTNCSDQLKAECVWTQSIPAAQSQHTSTIVRKERPRPRSSITQYQQLRQKSESLCKNIRRIAPDVHQYNDYAEPVKWAQDEEPDDFGNVLDHIDGSKAKLSDQWFKKEGRLVKLSIQRSLEIKSRRKGRRLLKSSNNKTIDELIKEVKT